MSMIIDLEIQQTLWRHFPPSSYFFNLFFLHNSLFMKNMTETFKKIG